MYLCDCHTHTRISFDSEATLWEMMAAAQRSGLQELCVTDHCDLLDGDGTPTLTFPWPQALEQYRQRGESPVAVRLGLELSCAPYHPQAARDILAQAGGALDFVLGSLHNWIGAQDNRDFYYTRFTGDPALAQAAMENALTHTWTLVTQLPDCYDSLAHITYPLRYIARDGVKLTLEPFRAQIMEIFRQVAQSHHALEVNTCRGQALEEWLPILRWFKACGGEFVTVGSDAHQPEHMALGIPKALELLGAAGFSYVTTYQGRCPVPHKL